MGGNAFMFHIQDAREAMNRIPIFRSQRSSKLVIFGLIGRRN